jgi:ABC-type dipeptide/oligopeptide/nickel transport system permease component
MKRDRPVKAKAALQHAWRERRGSLPALIGARLAQAGLAVLGASVLVWALLPLAPGDPALRTLQARGVANPRPAEIAAMRDELKLDRPAVVQYFTWLGRAVRGDLSISYQSGRPVSEEIGRRLPATALLAGVALVFSILLAVAVALTGAAFYGKLPDKIVRLLTQAGAACPSFLLGLLALQFIVVGSGWGHVLSGDSLHDVWLPALCLSVGRASDWAQLLRANLLEALGAHYTVIATARGATRLRVLMRYALPNALLPFLTVVGVGVGSLLGGAAIIEAVFTYPGIGSYAVAAITARDLPVVQGFVVVSTFAYVTASFLVDLMSALIDPRLRRVGRAA